MGGDFNDIKNMSEKRGGSIGQKTAFKIFVTLLLTWRWEILKLKGWYILGLIIGRERASFKKDSTGFMDQQTGCYKMIQQRSHIISDKRLIILSSFWILSQQGTGPEQDLFLMTSGPENRIVKPWFKKLGTNQ